MDTTLSSAAVNEETNRQTHAAVWYTVAKIIEEEEATHSSSSSASGITASEAFVAGLASVVHTQCQSIARDMEAYMKHANRKTIGVEDVLLLAKHNPELKQRMIEFGGRDNILPPGLKTTTETTKTADQSSSNRPRARPKAKKSS